MPKEGSDKGLIFGIFGIAFLVLTAIPSLFTASRRNVSDQEYD